MKDRDIGHLSLLTILMLFLGGCLATGFSDPSPQVISTDESLPLASATATEIPSTATALPVPSATATRLPASPTASPTPEPLCNSDDVSAFIVAFADAFNAADQERLAAMLPVESYPYAPAVPQPGMDQHQFRGFGLQTDTNDIGDRDALLLDFATRYAAGERWRVQYVVVGEGGAWQGTEWHLPELSEIGVQLIRQTADLAPYTANGKGLVNCVDETLIYFWGGGPVPGIVVDESMIGGVAPIPHCNVDEVSAFVTALIDAFNAGDQARLDALLPDENHPYAPAVLQPGTDQHQFRGFSLRSDVVAGRDELLAELAERQASGERWEFRDIVVDVDLDPRFEMPQVAVIGLRLTQLKGEDARYPVTGKGAVNCVDQTLLFFWGG